MSARRDGESTVAYAFRMFSTGPLSLGLTLLWVAFTVLKVVGVPPVASWSWWRVLAPLWAPIVVGVVLAAVIAGVAWLVLYVITWRADRRAEREDERRAEEARKRRAARDEAAQEARQRMATQRQGGPLISSDDGMSFLTSHVGSVAGECRVVWEPQHERYVVRVSRIDTPLTVTIAGLERTPGYRERPTGIVLLEAFVIPWLRENGIEA